MQLGSLWIGEDKNGNKYFSGELDLITTKVRVGIFKNTNKEEGSKQPDYRIVKLEERPREEASDNVPF